MMRNRQAHSGHTPSSDNSPLAARRRPTTTATQNLLDDGNDDDWEDIVAKNEASDDTTTTLNSKSGWCWYLWSWVLVFSDVICMLGFIAALLPGFIRFAWFYAISSNRTSVKYGTQSCRQTMDVYFAANSNHPQARVTSPLPASPLRKKKGQRGNLVDDEETSQETGSTASDSSTSSGNDADSASASSTTGLLGEVNDDIHAPTGRPVVLFFPGGAWMIGYKMWAALTARVLAEFNIVTVVADYRNRFPGICDDVTMPDMVGDVSAAIEWTIQNISKYGGDPSRIVIVGQSAGGHLSTTALLKRAMRLQDATKDEASATSSFSWKPTDLKGLIAVSAPYHFPQMSQTFRKHGLGDHVMDNMFGDCQQDDYDPLRLVQQIEQGYPSMPPLPPIQVWHGAKDATVPCHCAQEFAQTLIRATKSTDIPVGFRMYESWTHTDGILEGPMSGNHEFHRELARAVQELASSQQVVGHDSDSSEVFDWHDHHTVLHPLWVTQVMAKVGMFCNPF
mmetsp:Transcript_14195/g.39315  ORF Transcript_14195/g.39315 Transcript_14195/m.39315 type:complete len:507 (-) Transcript_14195:282-1802(-)